MATTIQLQLSLDASGAVTGITQLGDKIKRLPAPPKQIADELKRGQDAAKLFNKLTGGEMPEALQKAIGKSSLIGPLMSKAFSVVAIIQAAEAVGEFAEKVAHTARWLGGMTEDVQKMKEAAVAANNEAFANPKNLEMAQRNTATLATASQHASEMHEKFEDMNVFQKAWLYWGAKVSTDMEEQLHSMDRQNEATEQHITAMKAEAELAAKMFAMEDEAAAKAKEAGKTGFRLLNQQLADFKNTRAMQLMLVTNKPLHDALTHSKEEEIGAQSLQLMEKVRQETMKMEAQSTEAVLSGENKIYEATGNRIRFAEYAFKEQTGYDVELVEKRKDKEERFNDLWQEWQRRRTAITNEGDFQRAEMHRQTLEQITQMEEQAAVASLPEWERGTAQIENEYKDLVRKIDHDLKASNINEGEANRERVVAWEIANAKIREEHKRHIEQLGSDLESVFDDISSGKIGERILKNMKKLFFQIVAAWLEATGFMKTIFGKIFGTLVGGPGTSAEQSSGGGLLGSILGLFGASGSAVPVAGTAAGATSAAGFLPAAGTAGGWQGIPFALPGGSSTSGAVSAVAGSANAGLSGTSIGQGIANLLGGDGSATGGLSLKAGTTFKSLFSAQNITSLGTLALSLGAGLIGGKAGQVGGMLSALTLMAQANPGGPAAMLLSHFGLMSGLAGTIFASLGPALIGFGVGTHFGPLGGALAGGGVGFGVGALIGLAGGPIGALIGGIVGAIAGLFGGLFGSGKRKRQANAFANNTVLPAVQQIEDQYKNFSLDYTSSISQLEDLRKQAQDQLGKLKGEGRDVMKKVVGPAIDHAEADINGFEAERQRRAALTFGPPEFHSGGLVDTMTRSFTGRPGDLLAVLSRGEFVVNPQATARNRRTLEAINSGGSAALSVGEIHIHPATLDRAYVRSGFKQDLLDALKSLRKEGRL